MKIRIVVGVQHSGASLARVKGSVASGLGDLEKICIASESGRKALFYVQSQVV